MQRTLAQINEWHDAYFKRLVERGIDPVLAEATLDAGMGDHDYDDNPSDAADMELSHWSE